jgi:hypothetical protein
MKDESSEPDCSNSDEDLDLARREALIHIQHIMEALNSPTPPSKVALYQTATLQARNDLCLFSSKNQQAIKQNVDLSINSTIAIQAVATMQKGSNCRHNPILRKTLIFSRAKIFASKQKNIGFELVGNNRGKITNRYQLIQYAPELYKAVRKIFPTLLRQEFNRLQKKYNFTQNDFGTFKKFNLWCYYLKSNLDHKRDLIALHHIAYKEKYPGKLISTRNLEVVTDAPRSPQKGQPEGTHSANHRMMAIGEADIMKTQSPQVLNSYKRITSQERIKKGNFVNRIFAYQEDGYETDSENETISRSKLRTKK